MSAPAHKNRPLSVALFTLALAAVIFGLLAVLWGQDWRWAPTAVGGALLLVLLAGVTNSNRH